MLETPETAVVSIKDVNNDSARTLCTQENTPKVNTKHSNVDSGVKLLRKSRSNISTSLPAEILLSIFLFAIPPYALLDTTLTAGGNSTWNQALRLMKSVVLVSRGWYDAGVIFLYQNICIRRRQELESLRQTLTSLSANNLGLLVKSLAIQCYVPEDNSDFGADLETVRGCCTSLSTFALNTPFVPPPQAMAIAFPAQITHFRLEGYSDYGVILPVLKQLETTLLSLHILLWGSSDLKFIRSQFLCLSSLRSLTVAARQEFRVIGHYWAMPSLQRLTIATSGLFHYDSSLYYPDIQSAIVSFLSVHGRQIRQLNIETQKFRFKPEIFKKVLKFCPQLERIITDPSTFLRKHWADSDDYFHPHLRCIDFPFFLRHKDDYRPSELCLSKKNLPSLECVRRFCNLPVRLYQWLEDYPPNPEAEMGEFVMGVFQHHLVCHEGLYVWMLERDVLEDRVSEGEILSGSFTVWEDSGSDEDSDYIPTTSELFRRG